MCTRTKTSYGCGHTYKTTVDCNERRCPGLERYHYQKDGDCLECKRGGTLVTRGREGQGRYAQALKRRDPGPPVYRVPFSSVSGNASPSPWAASSKPEYEKRSPIRAEADDAWLREHERRQRDLERTSERPSERSSPSSSLLGSPRPHKWQDDYSAAVREHMRRNEESERIHIRRQRERSDSYDSFPDSFGGSRGSQGSSRSRHHGHDPAYESPSTRYYSQPPTSSSHHRSGYEVGEIVRDSCQLWNKW